MKISFQNLGTIKEAQIEFKPLTVFIGENGTGKTWTAYTFASIMGPYGLKQYLDSYLENSTKFKFDIIENTINQFIENGNSKISLAEFVQNYTETYINQIAKSAPNWINSYMATKRVNFDDLNIHVELSEKFKHDILEKLNSSRIFI